MCLNHHYVNALILGVPFIGGQVIPSATYIQTGTLQQSRPVLWAAHWVAQYTVALSWCAWCA